jgi:hypothetical protein
MEHSGSQQGHVIQQKQGLFSEYTPAHVFHSPVSRRHYAKWVGNAMTLTIGHPNNYLLLQDNRVCQIQGIHTAWDMSVRPVVNRFLILGDFLSIFTTSRLQSESKCRLCR